MEFAFEARIVAHQIGRAHYSVIFLPERYAGHPPFEKSTRLRMRGHVGHIALSAAWQPLRGRWFVMLSKRLMQQSGYRIGDTAMLRFQIEADTVVNLPWELSDALNKAPRLHSKWKKLTPGAQRAFAHRIASARREETRQKRLTEVLGWLRDDIRSLQDLRQRNE
jgi:hypothetical protein